MMKKAVKFAVTALALWAAGMASAQTYTYNEMTSTTTQWSAGTSWDAVPVSAANTILTFTSNGTLSGDPLVWVPDPLAAGTNIISNNDIIGNFLLNRLNFTYTGAASAPLSTVTITGSPLEFTGASAQLLYQPGGTNATYRPALIINNQIVLSSSLTINGQNTQSGDSITLAGQITGAGQLTFNGGAGQSQRLILSNTNNDYAGDTLVLAGGTSGGTRTLRLGASGVIPNGAAAGNVFIHSSNEGGKNAQFQIFGFDETINALTSGTPGASAASTQSVQNGGATGATLTVGDNNASGTFIGFVANGSTGALGITKIGAGTQVLGGNSTYTGTTTVSAGTLKLDYTLWSHAKTNDPVNCFSTGSGVILNGGATLAIEGRGDGAVIEQTGVGLGQYSRTLTLSNANASQLSVGQELFFEKTGGAGTPATDVYITAMEAGASNTTIYTNKRLGGTGGSTATVTTIATAGTTAQTLASLTLSGAADSNATLDFGTSGNVTLTINSAPVQINDGSQLTIANWAGTPFLGGGSDRLLFLGSPTDFSSVFGQSEVIFDGYGAGYVLVDGSGTYEVAAIPEPGTIGLLMGGLVLASIRRRRRG